MATAASPIYVRWVNVAAAVICCATLQDWSVCGTEQPDVHG